MVCVLITQKQYSLIHIINKKCIYNNIYTFFIKCNTCSSTYYYLTQALKNIAIYVNILEIPLFNSHAVQ